MAEKQGKGGASPKAGGSSSTADPNRPRHANQYTKAAALLAAQQQQWDPFLLVNSIGILLGFRTAFCQGLDDNMRKKIAGLGLPLPRWLFKILDHICHTVPPAVLRGPVGS